MGVTHNKYFIGFAFKKDTSDIRESASIDICKYLLEEGATLFIYDPQVSVAAITREFPDIKNINIVNNAYSAAFESNAIVLLTDWDEFKELDYNRIYVNTQKPVWFFDGRNAIDHSKLKKIGYNVVAIGKNI